MLIDRRPDTAVLAPTSVSSGTSALPVPARDGHCAQAQADVDNEQEAGATQQAAVALRPISTALDESPMHEPGDHP